MNETGVGFVLIGATILTAGAALVAGPGWAAVAFGACLVLLGVEGRWPR